MQCNIDDRGARFRRNMGIAWLIISLLLAAVDFWLALWWLWIIVGLAAVGGAFSLFESRNKWCAIRAMGIKTRI